MRFDLFHLDVKFSSIVLLLLFFFFIVVVYLLFYYSTASGFDQRLFDVFRGHRKRLVAWNGLTHWTVLPRFKSKIDFRQIGIAFCRITLDALRDLVPFVQFQKPEKHLWRSVTFSIACNFTESNTPPWVIFTFLKLYKWHQIAQCISYTFCFIWVSFCYTWRFCNGHCNVNVTG